MAMLQVVINPLLRTAGGEENYAFTSVLAQLIFGGASYVSPLVYSYLVLNLNKHNSTGIFSILQPLVPANLPWISLYWLFTVICIFMFAIMLISKFPKVELAEDEKAGPWKTHVLLFKKPVVILYFIALFCYVGTEQGVSYWMSQFLFEYHKFDPQVAGAHAVSNFWGLMLVGGILGLVLLKLIDSRKLLILFTVPAIILLSLALFGSAEISLYSFPIIGFFMSVMYPIIFSLALSSVSEDHGSFAGILVTGIIGGAVVQLLIGGLGNLIGLKGGMLVLYITFGYMLSIGFWAKPLIVNEREVNAKRIGYVGAVVGGLVGISLFAVWGWIALIGMGSLCSLFGFGIVYLISLPFFKNSIN
jgi:fucose permease